MPAETTETVAASVVIGLGLFVSLYVFARWMGRSATVASRQRWLWVQRCDVNPQALGRVSALHLALAGVAGLFLQMATTRWLAGQLGTVGVVYLNTFFAACLLGFVAGWTLWRTRINLLPTVAPLAVLLLLAKLPYTAWSGSSFAASPGETAGAERIGESLASAGGVAGAVALLVLLFALMALMFIPAGQLARAFLRNIVGGRPRWLSAAAFAVGIAWLILLLPVAAYAASAAFTPLASVALYAAGRTGECPLAQAAGSYKNQAEQSAVTAQVRRASKLLVRDANGLELWNTPHGRFWTPKGTDLPFLLAEQQRGFYGSGMLGVRAGDIVLDCGANVGTFTRKALSAGARLVVAIDPAPENVECLRRTFEREVAAGQVIVYPKGVWHQDDELTMWVYENSALDSFVMEKRTEEQKKPRAVTLPVTRIDKLVAELKLDKVDFVKMDIEGAETSALEGAHVILTKFRPRLAIATENLPDDYKTVPPLVRKAWAGYRQACGKCSPVSLVEIRPDVFFFF